MSKSWLVGVTLLLAACGGDIKKDKAHGGGAPVDAANDDSTDNPPTDDITPPDDTRPDDTSQPDVTPPDDVAPPDDVPPPDDAIPLHVQLTWNTANTDLDVHVAHEAAGLDSRQPDLDEDGLPDPWLHGIYDCNWRNKAPDWGAVGLANDPSEDIDDTQGYGPENVNIDDPESDVTYRVGVRYYADNAMEGPTTATVKIFFDGTLVGEYSTVLTNTRDFWEVATVTGNGIVSQVRGPKITPGYSPDGAF